MVILDKGQIFFIPEFNRKHLFLIIYVSMCLFRRLLPLLVDSWGDGAIITSDFNKSCVLDMVSNFTADSLTGLYVLYKFIKKLRAKKVENLIENEKRSYSSQKEKDLVSIKEQERIDMKKRFFIIMAVIAVVDIIAQLCLLVFSYVDTNGCTLNFNSFLCRTNKVKLNEDDLIFTVALNIVFRYIFSYLLLTIHIYYHHKISMIITMISFIPIVVFNFYTLKNKEGNDLLLYMFLNFIMQVIYAFEDVMNKIALSKLVLRPPELMFYKAVFQRPLFAIVFIIVFIRDKVKKNIFTISFSDYIIANSPHWYGRIISRLTFIVANIFRTMSLQWVTEVLSPNHISILKSFEFVVLTLLSLLKEKLFGSLGNTTTFYIIELISCFFLLFASLIHNEFFIINRFHLMKSTDYYKSLKEDNKFDQDVKDIELWSHSDENNKDENNKNVEEKENILFDENESGYLKDDK